VLPSATAIAAFRKSFLFFALVAPLKIHAVRCFLIAVRLWLGFARLGGSAASQDTIQSVSSLQRVPTQRP
jgi:hypothetical protein